MSRSLRLIKFDIIHPQAYLRDKQAGVRNLEGLSLEDYRDWLLSLASNYSDFYTHHLNETGEWEAEEYFFLDPVFNRKVAQHLYGKILGGLLDTFARAANKLKGNIRHLWVEQVAHAYIRSRNPDVLFARTQTQASSFWQRYREDTLLVARLSARLPINWHPNDWDLIYTDQPDFQTFFRLHGVNTILNDQGFDPRIVDRLVADRPSPGVVFIGGLGTQNFLARTEFFERIALRTTFTWWGYWWAYGGDGRSLSDFPGLKAGFRGPTSGLEMYQTYYDADICLNDYVDTANGIGFNQRMFEVMGAGGFLLTRMAPNFAEHFPEGIFATYEDDDDCLRQIDYYLDHPEERAAIARRGQKFVLDNYSYVRIAREFGEDLKQALREKREGPVPA